MAKIRVRGTGLVYQGSGSDPHLRNAYFPSVVQMPQCDLVATMDLGSGMVTCDTRSYCSRSTDGGRTWSRPHRLFQPDESSYPVHTTCRMCRTPDGRLVGFVALTDRSRSDTPATNPQNGGGSDMELALISSCDGGATWSPLQKLKPPLDWKCFEICHPILPLNSNRWLLPVTTRHDWDGRCPLGIKAFVFVSEDGGRTWPSAVPVFDFWADGIAPWEQKHTLLSDGRILAICWPFNTWGREDLPNRYSFSMNNGLSYGRSQESPLHGQTCTPIGLDDGYVLSVYRRLDERGLWAHLARIDGPAWRPVTDLPLWGQGIEALPNGLDSRMEHLCSLRFGYPTIIRLADGDVFVVFWCVEDELSVIRWFKLHIEF